MFEFQEATWVDLDMEIAVYAEIFRSDLATGNAHKWEIFGISGGSTLI